MNELICPDIQLKRTRDLMALLANYLQAAYCRSPGSVVDFGEPFLILGKLRYADFFRSPIDVLTPNRWRSAVAAGLLRTR
ncbi:hypothetical protein [Duganella sp. CF458]|uniref:hypothetical protein n=1 Tax=Duganella sp. CF458 TaxID=1884368 RepID=UPI001480475A|nr:hypothetical protein [Duganella sp. CF458]